MPGMPRPHDDETTLLLAFVAQQRDLLVTAARREPSFRIAMGLAATGLIEENGVVTGVRLRPRDGAGEAEELRADVVIACAGDVPTDLGRGSRVDVWVIGEDRRQRAAAELVLGDVLVVDAPVVSDSFASATSRQLVLAVPQDDEESLGLVLAASGDDRVRVVGRS